MARYAEILERRQRGDDVLLLVRLYMDGTPDETGAPTTVELGNVVILDGSLAEVKDFLTEESKRLQQLHVGRILNL